MPPPTDNKLIEFVIADATYCRGDCSLTAISRKQAKYDNTANHLRARGFRVRGFDDRSLLPKEGREGSANHIAVLALGISGEVFQATRHVLSALGLDTHSVTKLIKTLHLLSLEHTYNILQSRQFLDKTLTHHTTSHKTHHQQQTTTAHSPQQHTGLQAGPQPAAFTPPPPHPPAGEG